MNHVPGFLELIAKTAENRPKWISGGLCICHGQCMSKWSRRSTRLRPQMCRDLSHQLQKCQKYIKSVSNRSATSYIYRHSSIAILRYKNLITSICKRISKKSYQANPVMHCVYLSSSYIHIPGT